MQLETRQSTIHQHNPEVLQRLFTENYRHVQEVASGSGLSVEEIDRIIEATRGQLHRYNGPDDDAEFCSWITEVIAPARDRISRFLAMRDANSKIVRKGLWSIIKNCSSLGAEFAERGKDQQSSTVEELEQLVWTKVFIDLDRWIAPGYSKNPKRKPAKLSTRLYAFARAQAMGWRTDRIRARAKFVPLIDDDGVLIEEKLLAEYGRPKERTVVLGPGDEGAHEVTWDNFASECEDNSAQAA